MKKKFFLLCGGFLVSCAVRRSVLPPGDPERGVTVRAWGHSCFSLEDSAGRTFLVDPFDDTVGYPPPQLYPDAALVTHEHFDHDAVARTPVAPPDSTAEKNGNKPTRALCWVDRYPVVRSTGTQTVAGIEVVGVLADHDDEGGRRNGTTRFYVWEMGGLRWAHLGDIGQKTLRPDQVAALTGVDVLFVPVGGRTTVDGVTAAKLVRQIHPRAVIPMHYGTAHTRFFEFDPLDRFLAQYEKSQIVILPAGPFLFRWADLSSRTTVCVFSVSNDEKLKEIP